MRAPWQKAEAAPYDPLRRRHSIRRADYGLVVGCDTPLVKTGILRTLVAAIEAGVDIVVPSSGTYFQPLCAVYAKRCAPMIEAQLQAGDFKILNLYARMTVKRIPYEDFRARDERLISFFNINT